MQATRLQDCTYTACYNAFANTRDDSSGYQDILHHGALVSGQLQQYQSQQKVTENCLISYLYNTFSLINECLIKNESKT